MNIEPRSRKFQDLSHRMYYFQSIRSLSLLTHMRSRRRPRGVMFVLIEQSPTFVTEPRVLSHQDLAIQCGISATPH